MEVLKNNMDIKYVTLEDGLDYIIVEDIKEQNYEYLFLVKEDDEKKFLIRKVIVENNKELLSPLDNEEEFEYALSLFNNKNKN